MAREWRGSLVHLTPNTEFEIEVRYQDEDGVNPTVVSSIVKTRPEYPDIGATGIVRTATNQAGLQAVLDSAEPGDTVQLLGGIYSGEMILEAENSGKPGQYITIEPAPGETVIFDGSDPELNSPANNWTFYATTEKGDVYYTDLPWGDAECGGSMLPHYVGELVQGEGIRYLLFTSDSESWDGDFLPAPAGKAFYICSGTGPGPDRRLYVVTYEGDDPDNHQMHVARKNWAIRLRGADFIRIRGFEIRYFSAAGIYLSYDSTSGADNNIIENNIFHGIGKRHLRISGKEGESWTVNNLIQNNLIYERGYRDSQWQWEVEYHHARGNANGIDLSNTGYGNVIRSNRIESGHDAIQVNTHSNDVDVYNNSIYECMDNGVEVDNDPGQNVRVWGNAFFYCYASISLQDWNATSHGPVYIFRNLIVGGSDPLGRKDDLGDGMGYDSRNAFKVGSDIPPDGEVYIYHNTVSVTFDELGEGDGIRDSGGDYVANMVARNNIWHVTGDVFDLDSPNTTINLDFDCDNLHDLDPETNSFIIWSSNGGPDGDGRYDTLGAFQSYTGQELNGISDLNTLFYPGFRLKVGSPDIDAGCLIPGFNDRGPYHYTSSAPDLGAFEYVEMPFSFFLPVISRK